METLEGIRCLYTTDTISLIKITTNYREFEIKLPYKKVPLLKKKDKEYKMVYDMSIKEYCKLKNISYRRYFHLLHKDIN